MDLPMAAVLARVKAALVAVCLVFVLALSSCSSAGGPLTGNYVDDTVSVAQSLLSTIALPQDDPSRKQAEADARGLINAYTARYRPQSRFNGLSSFTTMVTAVNSLAGHYASYANRPLPEALKARVEKELTKAQAAVVRGA
jgi:photosystem II Psb27 protein